jgi:hypothetical protein
VTTDDDAVLPPGEDRLDEAKLAETPFERVKFFFADAAWVGRVRAELVDRDLLHREDESERDSHALRSPTPSERGVSLTMRK